jgi:hypothetical protein
VAAFGDVAAYPAPAALDAYALQRGGKSVVPSFPVSGVGAGAPAQKVARAGRQRATSTAPSSPQVFSFPQFPVLQLQHPAPAPAAAAGPPADPRQHASVTRPRAAPAAAAAAKPPKIRRVGCAADDCGERHAGGCCYDPEYLAHCYAEEARGGGRGRLAGRMDGVEAAWGRRGRPRPRHAREMRSQDAADAGAPLLCV